jgi:succinate dehydrogenase / fumarate reductase cytochrome b subunit
VDHTRPKNLNLLTIRFPLPAIASILHRMSGFVLFLLIPVMLWGLSFSLTDSGFNNIQLWLSEGYVKWLFWALLIPFCYHLVAGLRHLLSDLHIGNTRAGGKTAAIFVFVISAILVILTGIWLW